MLYRVRAKRIATIAARIATAAYLTSRRVQLRGVFAGSRLGSRGHRLDEPITPPRYSLDKSRARALVAKNCSKAADDDVKTVIEVYVSCRATTCARFLHE